MALYRRQNVFWATRELDCTYLTILTIFFWDYGREGGVALS